MTTVGPDYGPWALIAGASDGVGAAFAERIAASGINVILLARRESLLDSLAAGIRDRLGVQTRTLAVDLAAPGAIDAITTVTRDVDVGLLVYCAGGDPDYARFLDNDIAAAERMLHRNCLVPMQLAHHYGGLMVGRGHGGIIILSSGAAFVGAANMVTYGATKAFDMIFAEALWSEFREHGVDALAVVLGETDTPSLRKLRHERALAGPDEPVPHAASVGEVVDDAFAMLGKGPTCMAGKQIRRGARLINPIPRGALVRLMGWVSRRQMGKDQ